MVRTLPCRTDEEKVLYLSCIRGGGKGKHGLLSVGVGWIKTICRPVVDNCDMEPDMLSLRPIGD